MEALVPPRASPEPEPEPEPEQLVPTSGGTAAPASRVGLCPHAGRPAESLSIVLEGAGKLGLGFNHSDTEPAAVVSVIAGSLASSAGVLAGMLLCRVASVEVGHLPCTAALESLRTMAAVRPLELGFAWPATTAQKAHDDNDGLGSDDHEAEGTAAQQLEATWSAILAGELPAGTPLRWPDWKQIHAGVVQTDTSPTISCPMDTPLDPASPQLICPNGAVCRATITWLSPDYSGLFTAVSATAAPGDHAEGLFRLSSALEPVNMSGWNPMSLALGSVSKSKLFPCGAFKAFRGVGIHSGNLLFAGRKTGQPEEEFFAHALCTHATEKVAVPLSPGKKTKPIF